MNELGNTPADKNYKPSGVSKAEERALEAYPPTFTSGKRYAKRVQSEKVDTHAPIRSIFIKGYEQAEKDLALTWENIQRIVTIADLLMTKERMQNEFNKLFISPEAYYTEILNRFNKSKEEK